MSSTGLGRSPSTSAARLIPTTGTSSEYGATTPAGLRRSNAVQMPAPTTVASTAMYATASNPGTPAGVNAARRASHPAPEPSTTQDAANSGTGGTTDIHSV